MFAFFEKLLPPFPPEMPTRPPATLISFCRHYTRGAWPWIFTVSVLVGAIRGFIAEAFSLIVWAAAFFIAFQYSGAVAMQLEGHIELPSARTALAFAGLFLSVLLVGGLLTTRRSAGPPGRWRALSGLVGALRALIGGRATPQPAQQRDAGERFQLADLDDDELQRVAKLLERADQDR